MLFKWAFINYTFSDSFIIEQLLNINILINMLINILKILVYKILNIVMCSMLNMSSKKYSGSWGL